MQLAVVLETQLQVLICWVVEESVNFYYEYGMSVEDCFQQEDLKYKIVLIFRKCHLIVQLFAYLVYKINIES